MLMMIPNGTLCFVVEKEPPGAVQGLVPDLNGDFLLAELAVVGWSIIIGITSLTLSASSLPLDALPRLRPLLQSLRATFDPSVDISPPGDRALHYG